MAMLRLLPASVPHEEPYAEPGPEDVGSSSLAARSLGALAMQPVRHNLANDECGCTIFPLVIPK